MIVIKEGFLHVLFPDIYNLQYLLNLNTNNQYREKSHRKNLLGCSKNVGGIDTYGIDRTIMTLHLSDWHKSIHVPKLQNASSAATEQNRVPWHHS